jgi:hypothetical protein
MFQWSKAHRQWLLQSPKKLNLSAILGDKRKGHTKSTVADNDEARGVRRERMPQEG